MPLLLALILFVAGIITESVAGASDFMQSETMRRLTAPEVLWAMPVVPALVAMVPAIRKRHGKTATAALCVALFATGAFVMRVNGSGTEKQSTTGGMAQAVTAFMAEKRAGMAMAYKAAGLSGDEYAVVAAMTLGEQQLVSRQLKEAYRSCGASHVFALSGLHLSILFFILRGIMPERKYPRAGIGALMATLWAYVMLVGAHASIVRAAIMLSIYTLLTPAGRNTDGKTALFVTAFTVLAIRPSWLFDIGFQMSFMAVLGITLFYSTLYGIPDFTPYRSQCPWFMQRRSRTLRYKALAEELFHNTIISVGAWIWGLTVLALTAQVAVAPLVAWHFGYFSPMFLLSNYVVSPCAVLIIPLAFAVLALYGMTTLLPCLSPVLALCVWCLNAVAEALNSAITDIASL